MFILLPLQTAFSAIVRSILLILDTLPCLCILILELKKFTKLYKNKNLEFQTLLLIKMAIKEKIKPL